MTVILVEDDAPLRAALTQSFDLADLPTVACSSFIVAKDHITRDLDGVILSDIRMPGKDGFDLVDYAQSVDPDLPVILLTGEGDVPTAIRAVQAGAYDFLEKPCETEYLLMVLRRALDHRRLTLKARAMEAALTAQDPLSVAFPGQSEAITSFRDQARKAAALPVDLHLWGAEGVGKRMAAEALHRIGGATGDFVTVTASGFDPSETTEAAGGTLCILGLNRANAADRAAMAEVMSADRDYRVIACSSTRLDAIEPPLPHGLHYPLSIMSLSVPSLTTRREDLEELFLAAVTAAAHAADREVPKLGADMIADVTARDWPHNLPELNQLAQRVVLGLYDAPKSDSSLGLVAQMEAFERQVIATALTRFDGRVTRVAEALEVPRKTLYDKLQRHGLKAENYRQKG